MRNTSLTAVALLGAALLTPMGAATAADETCRGQAATIVGTPGGEIVGTEGADVIVTNGATRVDARGGDDLVCGTGAAPFATILGAGADTFVDSSGGRPWIYAGAIVGREDVVLPDSTDTEADVIRAGSAVVISGTAGQPNADIIDLDLRRGRLERHPDRAGRAVRRHGGRPGRSIRHRRRHHGRQRHRDR